MEQCLAGGIRGIQYRGDSEARGQLGVHILRGSPDRMVVESHMP